MADAKSQPEPSMEEILASIRRIISEEEQPEAQAAKPEAPAAKAVTAAPAAPPAQQAASTPAAKPAPAAAARPPDPEPADDEVLDLTDKVAEDGTVVNLHAEGNAARRPKLESGPPSAQAEDIELRDVAQNGGREPPRMVEDEARGRRPAGDLVSMATAAATTASFAALAGAVEREGASDPLSVGGRSLEDIVKEILRPMLRDWLDANLPGLVERLVRREIERLSHRAQE